MKKRISLAVLFLLGFLFLLGSIYAIGKYTKHNKNKIDSKVEKVEQAKKEKKDVANKDNMGMKKSPNISPLVPKEEKNKNLKNSGTEDVYMEEFPATDSYRPVLEPYQRKRKDGGDLAEKEKSASPQIRDDAKESETTQQSLNEERRNPNPDIPGEKPEEPKEQQEDRVREDIAVFAENYLSDYGLIYSSKMDFALPSKAFIGLKSTGEYDGKEHEITWSGDGIENVRNKVPGNYRLSAYVAEECRLGNETAKEFTFYVDVTIQ